VFLFMSTAQHEGAKPKPNRRFRGLPPMKHIKSILTAALASALLSTSAFASTQSIPQVGKIVNPEGLSRQHLGSTVRLNFTVDTNGHPQDVAVVSTADRRLTESVVHAVSQWRFTPATQNGMPVSKRVTMPLEIQAAGTVTNVTLAAATQMPQAEKIVNPVGVSRQHVGSTVTLSLTVDENGLPQDVTLLSPADRRLSQSVRDAVSQWRFTPALQDGTPISRRITMPLEIRAES
jgi:TonB family protein